MAYVGENLDLGGGHVMLEPRTLAKMLDALDPSNSDLAMIVSASGGYSAAVLSRIAEAVVAVESDEGRAEEAQTVLLEQGADNVVVHTGPLADGAAYEVMITQDSLLPRPSNAAARQAVAEWR